MKKSRILNLLISLVVCVIFEIFTYNLTKDWLLVFITSVIYFCGTDLTLESIINIFKRKRVKLNIFKVILAISGMMTFFSFVVGVMAMQKTTFNIGLFMASFMIFLVSLAFFLIRKWE